MKIADQKYVIQKAWKSTNNKLFVKIGTKMNGE